MMLVFIGVLFASGGAYVSIRADCGTISEPKVGTCDEIRTPRRA